MLAPGPEEDLAGLLEHSAWVRRLAGSLVRDEALAEDLTQEAWLAALRHPPVAGLPVRPWLAQVLRNLVRMHLRGARRRQARESRTVPSSETQGTTPQELVERVELQRMLAGLVVELREPLRSTILLRYYEGLDSSEIAARQGVPAGTVRWRLKTGIDKLRDALDRAHGGDRGAWLPALAPLALLPPGPGAGPGAPVGLKIPGALGLKVGLSLALVLSVAATGFLVTRSRTAAPRPPARGTAASPAAAEPSIAQALPRLPKPQRDKLLQRIEHAQRSAGIDKQAATAGAATRELDAEYIRNQMQALLPLLKECYENALREQPRLDGKLVVSFNIVAEPDLGGLVTDSTIDAAKSTIADAQMRECVQETLYGAQFPAPRSGGEVHVTYPFVFATDR